MTALAARDIGIAFGGIKAVDGVSFTVRSGEVLSIIGPNGAGKTTLFNILSGLYRTGSGRVKLVGRDVTGFTPEQLAARGLSRTFQNLQIFRRMTAVENVMVGRHLHESSSLFGDLLRVPSVTRQNKSTKETALALLAEVGLRDAAPMLAGTLPYGACKQLEIARALASEPRVLLLDEPAAGCNAIETAEIDRLIRRVADKGVAIVLVEHDMKLVMKISDRILVLHNGQPLAEGSPAEVRGNPAVLDIYLGKRNAGEVSRA